MQQPCRVKQLSFREAIQVSKQLRLRGGIQSVCAPELCLDAKAVLGRTQTHPVGRLKRQEEGSWD